ncbi:MAG: hypothetical protein LBC68_09520 [Prevotellaceae bacterium]|jgi:hypothetical protein|nr:hypothetical protein [Prevotellaceae bacterium]
MHVARVALFGVASRYVEDKSKSPDLLQSGALFLIRHRQNLCRTGNYRSVEHHQTRIRFARVAVADLKNRRCSARNFLGWDFVSTNIIVPTER